MNLSKVVWIVFLLFLVTSMGCTKKVEPENPKYWLTQIGDKKNHKDAVSNLIRLKDKKVIPELITMLKQGKYMADIVHIFSEIGAASNMNSLLGVLNYIVGRAMDTASKDANRANQRIADAVARFNYKKGEGAMIKLLDARDQYVQLSAIKALGVIGGNQAVDKLVSLAMDDYTHVFINKHVIIALGAIGDSRAIPALIRNLFVERKGVSFYGETSIALFKMGALVVDQLIDVLNGKHELIAKLNAKKPIVESAYFIKAAVILGDIGDKRAVPHLLKRLNYEFIGEEGMEQQPMTLMVRMNTASALGRMGIKEAAAPIGKMLKITEPTTRKTYSDALNMINEKKVIPSMFKALRTGENTARHAVLQALTKIGDEKDLDKLNKILAKEKDEKLKKMYKREFVRLEAYDKCKQDMGCWIKILNDVNENWRVRERAAFELGRSGNQQVIDPLLKNISTQETDVRFAIIWALEQLKPMKGLSQLEIQLKAEKKKVETIRINEDLKRLVIKMKGWGATS